MSAARKLVLIFAASWPASAALASEDATPRQLHLAFAGADGVRVAWATNSSAANSTCVFGTSPGGLTRASTGPRVKCYMPGRGCHHSARLGPLAPATTYHYSCGGSPVNSFVSAPAKGQPANFSQLIFGDWGWLDSTLRPPSIPVGGIDKNWSASLTRELINTLQAQDAFDHWWIVGDIAC
jgi:hypothetical protein